MYPTMNMIYEALLNKTVRAGSQSSHYVETPSRHHFRITTPRASAHSAMLPPLIPRHSSSGSFSPVPNASYMPLTSGAAPSPFLVDEAPRLDWKMPAAESGRKSDRCRHGTPSLSARHKHRPCGGVCAALASTPKDGGHGAHPEPMTGPGGWARVLRRAGLGRGRWWGPRFLLRGGRGLFQNNYRLVRL